MFIEEQPMKLIRINMKTFHRLKEHARYYNHDEDGNVSSVDELITRLIDFYEQQNNKIEILYNDG